MRVYFRHAKGGLISRDGRPLTWFQIAGADHVFHDAEADIDGETVLVRVPSIPKPSAVRFAWHKLAEPNLSNRAGLPAVSFRSDN